MQKDVMIQMNKNFEGAACQEGGVEYWLARDLQTLLDYTEWRNFLLVIDKAKMACQNASHRNFSKQ